MNKSLLKRLKKVIEEGLKEFMERGFSFDDVVRIGERMMTQATVEEGKVIRQFYIPPYQRGLEMVYF